MCVALRKGVHGVESLFGACPALRRCLNADHVMILVIAQLSWRIKTKLLSLNTDMYLKGCEDRQEKALLYHRKSSSVQLGASFSNSLTISCHYALEIKRRPVISFMVITMKHYKKDSTKKDISLLDTDQLFTYTLN